MKTPRTIFILSLLGVTAGLSQQQRHAKPPHGGAHFVERFDVDGDGVLSEAEHKVAREQMKGRRPPRKGGKRGLEPHDEERHQRMLERFDKDGDGELSEEERQEAKKSLLSKWGDAGERKRKHLLEKYDADGDGKLSEEESAKARKVFETRHAQTNEYFQKAKEKFTSQFDADGNGELTEAGMQNAKKSFAEKAEQMRTALIEKYDKDGDGKLSEEEHRSAHLAEKREMLDRFDTDGDGDLNGEERVAAFDALLDEDPYRLLHMMLGNMRKENDDRRQGPKDHRDGPPRGGKPWPPRKPHGPRPEFKE